MIKKTKIRFWICCNLVCLVTVASAQKKFQIRIKLDTSIASQKIKYQYDDGRQTVFFPDSLSNKTNVILRGKYFSKYASFTVSYLTKENQLYLNTFFLGEQPAQIDLYYRPNPNQALSYKKLLNAQDVFDSTTNKTYRDLIHFNKDYNIAIWKFSQKHLSQLNKNDSLRKIYKGMLNSVNERTLSFLKEHSNDYFSFWYFKHQLTTALHDFKPDTAYLRKQLAYIKATFPAKYTQSFEGVTLINTYEKVINPLTTSETAPSFSVKSIDGKKIDLNRLKGRFVLLDFWATWCAPCMAEIPFIKDTRRSYPDSKLVIIGISQDHNLSKLRQVVNQRKMNWLHFFDNETEISRLYGINAFPTYILLDGQGNIIYKSDYVKDDVKEIPKVLDARLN